MRIATCSCGQLKAKCEGEPIRVSVCHCLECQKRTGAVFGNQARWAEDKVTFEGKATEWKRTGDSGGTATFRFCPTCGSTLYWTIDTYPGFVAVAVGGFADSSFGPPVFSVYEVRKHSWVSVPVDAEHMA
jgi:hypothetical protein